MNSDDFHNYPIDFLYRKFIRIDRENKHLEEKIDRLANRDAVIAENEKLRAELESINKEINDAGWVYDDWTDAAPLLRTTHEEWPPGAGNIRGKVIRIERDRR